MDRHKTPVQNGSLIECGNFAAVSGKTGEQPGTNAGVCHFTAAETHGDLDPVPFFEEFLCILQLDVEIIDVNDRGHAYFLDLYHVLVFLRFLIPLSLFKAELAIVHNLTNRGIGSGSDFYQVQVLVVCTLAGC